jgi:hypothetical protein
MGHAECDPIYKVLGWRSKVTARPLINLVSSGWIVGFQILGCFGHGFVAQDTCDILIKNKNLKYILGLLWPIEKESYCIYD